VRYASNICKKSVTIASIYGLENIFSKLFPDVLPVLPAKSSAMNTSNPEVAVLKPFNASFEAKLEEGRILVDKLSGLTSLATLSSSHDASNMLACNPQSPYRPITGSFNVESSTLESAGVLTKCPAASFTEDSAARIMFAARQQPLFDFVLDQRFKGSFGRPDRYLRVFFQCKWSESAKASDTDLNAWLASVAVLSKEGKH